jgi:hypothetical protein
MAERRQTKAERRQAQGDQPTKAERKQTKARRKERPDPAAEAVEPVAGADGSSDDGIELRLARLEEAVATQSELSEQLLGKLDEVLHEARKSARHAKTAVTRPGFEGQEEPGEEGA